MQDWETKVVMEFIITLIAIVTIPVVLIGFVVLLFKGIARFFAA